MKKSRAAVRLFATAALLMAASYVEAQQTQPPQPIEPGTPATTAPPPSTTAPQTGPSQPAVPAQTQTTTPPSTSLYGPFAIELFYWLPSVRPSLLGGKAATTYSNLDYPHVRKDAPGGEISIPVSRSGMLNFSGFITKGSSSTITPADVTLFGTPYSTGELITTDEKIKNFKLSFQDLLYPFPKREGQKWRLKSLWEVQYASISTNLNAPYAPTTDASGNPLVNTASGSRSLIYPSLGLAGEFHPTPHVELQVSGSGFAIPHHGVIGDAEAFLGYRISHVELVVGERYFHFKTSPQNSQYFSTTLLGAYGELRIFPGEISIPCVFCKKKSTTTAGTAGGTTETPSSTAANEAPPSPGPSTGSSSSAAPPPGVYVHRFSAGATLSVLAQSMIPKANSTVNNSTTLTTGYGTTGASSRFGYGLTAQVALSDRFSLVASGLLRRIGYVLDTTVTTTKPTVVAGVQTTVSNSTGVHEDTRATLIDVPLAVRFYTRDRHEPGVRWFFDLGGAWRDSRSIRTSISTTDAQSQLSCCTFTPAQPAHRSSRGAEAGVGVLLIDAFGIHFSPEVHYTRWLDPIFESFTTDTRRNEISAGVTLGF